MPVALSSPCLKSYQPYFFFFVFIGATAAWSQSFDFYWFIETLVQREIDAVVEETIDIPVDVDVDVTSAVTATATRLQ